MSLNPGHTHVKGGAAVAAPPLAERLSVHGGEEPRAWRTDAGLVVVALLAVDQRRLHIDGLQLVRLPAGRVHTVDEVRADLQQRLLQRGDVTERRGAEQAVVQRV